MIKCRYCVNKRRRKPIILSVLLLIAIGICLFFIYVVRPVINTYSSEYIRTLTVDSVNKSINKVMSENPMYAHLTEIEKDSDGNILLVTANAASVNSLTREVTECALQYLSELTETGVKIPIGSLCGISFLAGRGPNINIKAMPIGNLETAFSSEFTSAGINQTLHKLFLHVTASVNIVIPGVKNNIVTTTDVMIGEEIIIGKIPDVYLGTHSVDLSYNLIP